MKIYLLHGENVYSSRKKLFSLMSSFSAKYGLSSVTKIDGGVSTYQEVLSEIDAFSMFNNKKLVVIKYFGDNKGNKAFVESIKDRDLSNITDVTYIFWENKKIDKRSSFYKYLNENYEVEEFKTLTGKSLIKWVIEEFSLRDQKINSSVAECLVERVGDEMWRITSEIDKLCLYKLGENIRVEDVENAVPMSAKVEVWGLTNSIVIADNRKALKNLEVLITQGNDIFHIWGLIVWQFRQLIQIKYLQEKGMNDSNIGEKLGMRSFMVKKVTGVRKSISFTKLKIFYDKLVEIDYQMKTSQTDPLFAITLLLSVI